MGVKVISIRKNSSSPEKLILSDNRFKALHLLVVTTIEMEVSQFQIDEQDFCDSILSRFSSSIQEEHQHLCTVLGAMSQELKDQNLPTTPVTYFCTTCSSLDRLSSDHDSQTHIIDSLLTILSIVLPRISPAILKKKREYLTELVVRVLRSKSPPTASGLKCISHLLTIRESDNWSDVSQLYGLLLSFITDPHSKVRRQSHVCIRDTLESFQGSSALVPASEGILNTLERYLLLAGGSNTSASETPRGAQEVLYILDALKDCLHLMSMKSKTTVLKYLKTLMELHQPLLTRRIMDSLNGLCLHPTSEFSPEVLLELLCSLALSVSGKERSVDDITFTTRLLDVGMRKVHSLDRKICIVKLPMIFNALRDVLSSEHEEALYAATESLKSLIDACIDASLIKLGVNQITTNADMETRRSGPTIIEKLCATIESLLDYRYSKVWDMSFQVISTMFNKLGENSSYLLVGTLNGLADIQKLPDEDLIYRKQLHECIGSALVAMGPEIFLSIVPLKLEVEDLSEANVWILPILKQYTVGAHLSFFRESILNMVRLMKQKSRMFYQEGRIVSSRSCDALVYSLWSLFPSFCNYPLDTAESFKDMEKALCTTLHEEPNLCGIVCSSLQILIQQNKGILEQKIDVNGSDSSTYRQRAMARYTPQVAADNLTVIKSCAREFLPILSGKFLKSAQDGGCLQSTIHELASIADKEIVTRFFRNTMQKLLKVTQEAGDAETSRNSNTMEIDNSSDRSLAVVRAQLFDLAVSLLPGLNAKEIDLLFVAVKPALRDDEGLIQKKAYKVLSIILKNCDSFLSAKFEELIKLMIEVLPSCHFSAKHHRLECLYSLIVHASKCESEKRCDIIGSFLTEIILALKEANKKTRNRAYDMLVQIGHACGDEEKGGKKENLHQFFNMVAAGLAGETPHMISAAVKGLARLAYEFSDLVSTTYNLLPSTFLLLKRKNREIAKANLGLLKVLVAKSQTEGLQMHLRSMVEGLLNWQDSTKNQFKAKVKLLLEMLVKKCGMDAVKAVMPEEHLKLLTNIRKIKERKERKLAANSEETRSRLSKATTSRLSQWNYTKIFSSFGDGESEDSDAEYTDGKTLFGEKSKAALHFNSKASSSRMHKADKSLPEDLFDQLVDEPLDLLDQHKTRSALRSTGHLKRKPGLEDEPEIDSEGRLIIREGGRTRRELSKSDSNVRSQACRHTSINSSIDNRKRRKTSDSGWAYTGSEYVSKKAAGDVKRKDKLEPYAYWPLDRKMMSRRPEHRAAARKGMTSVVRLTKKLEGKSASSVLSSKGLRFKRVQKKNSKKKSK